MLVWMAEYLSEFYRPFSVFGYLTLRGILAVITALVISWVAGPMVIRQLNRLQMGQAIRSDGPKSHLSKAGTPTRGGALILLSIFTSTLLWGDLNSRYIWIVMGTTFTFGLVGWVDDYRKVVEKNPRGLPARRSRRGAPPFWSGGSPGRRRGPGSVPPPRGPGPARRPSPRPHQPAPGPRSWLQLRVMRRRRPRRPGPGGRPPRGPRSPPSRPGGPWGGPAGGRRRPCTAGRRARGYRCECTPRRPPPPSNRQALRHGGRRCLRSETGRGWRL